MNSNCDVLDDGTIVLRERVEWRSRAGRKKITTVFSPEDSRARWPGQAAIIRSLACAHAWQRMLDSGDFDTITDLAAYLKIEVSYVSRILRLMLLAPDIIDALIDGREPPGTSLEKLLKAQPMAWSEQRKTLGLTPATDTHPAADAERLRGILGPSPAER